MQYKHARSQVVNLLRAAVEPSLDLAIRQQAAIMFKQLCATEWDPDGTSQLNAQVARRVQQLLLLLLDSCLTLGGSSAAKATAHAQSDDVSDAAEGDCQLHPEDMALVRDNLLTSIVRCAAPCRSQFSLRQQQDVSGCADIVVQSARALVRARQRAEQRWLSAARRQ